MSALGRAGILCTGGLLIVASCLYPPVGRKGEGRPGDGRASHRNFSHERHEKTFEEKAFRCTDCHLYNVAFREPDDEIARQINRALKRAGLESCHFCHRERTEETKKRLKCIDCHGDVLAIRPQDHRAGWQDAHGSRIGQTEFECSQCHSNRYCVQCHGRRDTAARSYHRGSAILAHPVEARADPARCQRCHSIAYCSRCHQGGRF